MQKIAIEQIKPNPNQPRQHFDEAEIQELASNIRDLGLLQPILVRPQDDGYEIVHGERRWRACSTLGLAEIPAEVRDLDDKTAFLIAFTENIQRSDLSPIEEAGALRRMIDEFGYTQAQVGDVLGKSQQYVADRLSLLKLSEPVQAMITTRAVSPSAGRLLARMDDSEEAGKLAEQLADGRMSVRELEAAIRGETFLRDEPWVVLQYVDEQFDTLRHKHDLQKEWAELEGELEELRGGDRDEWVAGLKKVNAFSNTAGQVAGEFHRLWVLKVRAIAQLKATGIFDSDPELKAEVGTWLSQHGYWYLPRLSLEETEWACAQRDRNEEPWSIHQIVRYAKFTSNESVMEVEHTGAA